MDIILGTQFLGCRRGLGVRGAEGGGMGRRGQIRNLCKWSADGGDKRRRGLGKKKGGGGGVDKTGPARILISSVRLLGSQSCFEPQSEKTFTRSPVCVKRLERTEMFW